jgi:hypothetical protein
MPSKIVVDKEKSANAVVACGRANAGALAQALAEQAPPPAALTPDAYREALSHMILASCDRLEAAAARMVKADEAYLLEQSDDAGPRQKRDDTAAVLYSLVVELRESAQGAFGARELPGLGFSAAAPDDPAQLARFAGEVLAAFQQKKAAGEMPAPRRGFTFDPAEALLEIAAKKRDLEGHLKSVAAEQRELQAALALKNEAIAGYDATFSQTAHLLVGLLRAAGREELADKVRPNASRPGQIREPSPQSAPPKPTPDPN